MQNFLLKSYLKIIENLLLNYLLAIQKAYIIMAVDAIR